MKLNYSAVILSAFKTDLVCT